MQIRPSGTARYTQHLANLRVRKALDIMEHNHRPRTIGKGGERRFQSLPQLTAFSRIVKGARHGIRELLCVPHLATASEVESRVGDDAIQPGSEGLRRIESIQRLVRAQKSFLHRVFGIFVRQDDRACYRVRPSLMQPHEPGKAPIITRPGKADELFFLIRNTDGRVGLLGQRSLHRALVVSYGSSFASVA